MAETESRVFIIDDDLSVRKGLERLLRSVGYPVEAFASAADFLDRAVFPSVCCIILDVRMPEVNGLDLQARLMDSGCELPIIFLTGYGNIPMSVQAMKQGAVDFLTKPVDEEKLLEAVQNALARHRTLLGERCRVEEIQARIESLTPRELEVLRYVIAGALNKQIAAYLGIAEKTVKVHRGRMMEKMGVTTVAKLVQLCAIAGVSPEPTR